MFASIRSETFALSCSLELSYKTAAVIAYAKERSQVK